jgi:D-glycero-alpha-D-manno-heptose 1-phosphate guanylyltransferase
MFADEVTALILAGGFGTRIQGVLHDLPKPMAPVNGKPFVEWIVRWLKKQGINKVVISTGYRSEILENHFATQPVADVHICCIRETAPLGTGGGIRFAATQSKVTPEYWLVLNGDSLIFTDLKAVFDSVEESDGVIITRRVQDTSRYGTVMVDCDGIIESFAEKQSGAGLINGGIYLMSHELVKDFPGKVPLSVEKEVFPNLIAEGKKLKAHPTDAGFLDIGTPESLFQAEQFIVANMPHFDNSIR